LFHCELASSPSGQDSEVLHFWLLLTTEFHSSKGF